MSDKGQTVELKAYGNIAENCNLKSENLHLKTVRSVRKGRGARIEIHRTMHYMKSLISFAFTAIVWTPTAAHSSWSLHLINLLWVFLFFYSQINSYHLELWQLHTHALYLRYLYLLSFSCRSIWWKKRSNEIEQRANSTDTESVERLKMVMTMTTTTMRQWQWRAWTMTTFRNDGGSDDSSSAVIDDYGDDVKDETIAHRLHSWVTFHDQDNFRYFI